MTDRIENTGISSFTQAPQIGSGHKKVKAASVEPDDKAAFEYAAIEPGLHAPQDDQTKVKQAKKLLASGKLDNTANIKAAAGNILTFGV